MSLDPTFAYKTRLILKTNFHAIIHIDFHSPWGKKQNPGKPQSGTHNMFGANDHGELLTVKPGMDAEHLGEPAQKLL